MGRKLCLSFIQNFIKLIFVLFAVSVLCFVLISFSPIDPIRAFVGEIGAHNTSAEMLDKLKSYFELDIPLHIRYWNWFSDFLCGEMGSSLIYRQPVSDVIAKLFKNSFILMLLAWIISGVLGFFMGIVAGINKGKLVDKIVKGYAYLLTATPTFWLALVMLMVFAVWLKWFPIGLSTPIGKSNASILEMLRHLILPAVTLSIVGVANMALHTREKICDIMNEDYVIYARARGNSTSTIVREHAIRNALIPAITIQFSSIGEVFGGSVLIEQVFSYPGLGQAAVKAGLSGDAPLLLGIAMISAILVFSGNLIANILYQVVDPRNRSNYFD